jgi:hypothetical protein
LRSSPGNSKYIIHVQNDAAGTTQIGKRTFTWYYGVEECAQKKKKKRHELAKGEGEEDRRHLHSYQLEKLIYLLRMKNPQ